jgi:hypothetical protein
MTTLNKTLFTLAILTFLFVRCSNDSKENKKNIPVNSLEDLLATLAPTSQSFKIDPTEEVVLTGDKGTVIYIPADAFQFADGTTPTGKVAIELKECYSLIGMIAENMNTTSEGHVLETAGMTYFNATADGKQLSIKNGKAFVIGFPKGNQTEEMDLFYDFAFTDTSSTWVPDYKMYEAEAMKIAQADTIPSEGDQVLSINYPIEMTEDLFDYGFTVSMSTGTFYELPLVGQNRTIIDYIEDPTTITDSIAKKFLKNNWRVHYDLNIDINGKITNLRAADDEHTKHNSYALKIVKVYFENAPAFDLVRDTVEVKHDWDYSLGVMGSVRLNNELFKKRFREQYSQYTNQAIQKMDRNAVDYYVFAVTKMDWINCDRFWNMDAEEKTDFIVSTPTAKDAKVQIVFNDINSIMAGTYKKGRFVFNNVPLGRRIKVIGIGYANGKPTMSVDQTTIDNDGFELNAFKEFSLDDLEKELNH